MDAGAEVERDPAARGRNIETGQALRAVTRQALSVGIATGAYGISFGAVSVASGTHHLADRGAVNRCCSPGGRSSPSSASSVPAGAGSPAVATSTLLGVRNGLYALQVSRILQVRGPSSTRRRAS